MEKTKRTHSKKSHSWWWDSHLSRKNSKWLAESLAEMDQSMKQMLKLIEEDGDSFATKAEMYYAKRPELVSHVEDFYRMYHALAERYDQVTGNLRKKIKSELKSENLVAAGSDHSSGGSPRRSKKNNDDSSSSSSSSESDVDDLSEANYDGDSSVLQQRILELENELSEVKEKLRIQEEKCYDEHNSRTENGNSLDLKSKVFDLEEQLSAVNDNLNDSQVQISVLQKKLEESTVRLESVNGERSSEKEKATKLEEQILLLQDEILGHKHEIVQLKDAAETAATELHSYSTQHNDLIEQLRNEVSAAKESHLQEKAGLDNRIVSLEELNCELNFKVERYKKETLSLEARILELEHIIYDLKNSSSSSMEKLLQEKSTLEARVSELERIVHDLENSTSSALERIVTLEANICILSQSKTSLEAEVTTLIEQTRQFEAERISMTKEHVRLINELNQNIDALKSNIETLTAEKEALFGNLKSRDEKISQMDQHLNQLHSQHAKTIADIEASARLNSELRARVKELEEEVEQQKAVVSENAEGKREAIRQLCFSLEHYRDGYNELRQLLQSHRRSAIMAS